MIEPIGAFVPQAKRVWTLGDPVAPTVWLSGGIDPWGVEWAITAPEAWRESPPIKLGLEDRPDDGAWFGRGAYQARVLEIDGAFLHRAADEDLLDETAERLQGALHPAVDTLLSVTERVPKQLTVRPSGKVGVYPVRGNRRIRRFSFVLTAADPFKYAVQLESVPLRLMNPAAMPGITHPLTHPVNYGGAPVDSQDRQTVVNAGNLPVAPVLVFDGPVPRPAVTNRTTGERFGLDLTLAAGQTAAVDLAAKSVLVDGVPRAAARSAQSEWWRLNPGPNDLQFTADTYDPAAKARLTFRPRWK